MILKLESNTLDDYLTCTGIVDFDHPKINSEALRLASQSGSSQELIKNAYEFVRDAIAHSVDVVGTMVTCKASEVLIAKEGLCFAKSHLLAALLRCNDIPVGFCYHALRSSSGSSLVLHGFVAVFMENLQKWVRLDPRGNKKGIDAQFGVIHELLAYQVNPDIGEIDFPIVFAEPDVNVVAALSTHKTVGELLLSLPQFPAKMDWCRMLSMKLATEARLDVNPIGFCGHHCGFCFLGQWCGGCRSSCNHCSYASISADKICPNVRCAGERNLQGCYECGDLDTCKTGYYERDDEYIAKASALFIRRHGEKSYADTLKTAMKSGFNYPETFDSSGSVENALSLLERFFS